MTSTIGRLSGCILLNSLNKNEFNIGGVGKENSC